MILLLAAIDESDVFVELENLKCLFFSFLSSQYHPLPLFSHFQFSYLLHFFRNFFDSMKAQSSAYLFTLGVVFHCSLVNVLMILWVRLFGFMDIVKK